MNQLFLPGWLVAKMTDENRRFAESLIIGSQVEWIEHPGGVWEVRASDPRTY